MCREHNYFGDTCPYCQKLFTAQSQGTGGDASCPRTTSSTRPGNPPPTVQPSGGGTPDFADQAAKALREKFASPWPKESDGIAASIIRSYESERLAALEKDKERLDWIELNPGNRAEYCLSINRWVIGNTEWSAEGQTLRESIDAAITATKTEREK